MKTIKFAFLLLGAFLYLQNVQGQSPTFASDVAPILYKNCTSCHRDGSIGPFTIESYKDAYAMRFAIASSVESKKMPPWPPDITYNRLAHERVLTDVQIKTISEWVKDGAPRGDSTQEPSKPVFSNQSLLPKTDFVFSHPTYTIPISTDDYRVFVMKSGLTSDKYITGMEFKPGNTKVVHHILFYKDTSGTCATLDANDSKPGYSAGAGGVGANVDLLAGWVPGTQVNILPKGMGIKVTKGSDYVMQVHYAPGSKGQTDSTTINIQYSDGTSSIREITLSSPLVHVSPVLKDGPLFIPAGKVKKFTEEIIVPGDASVMNVAPHMHNIATKVKVYAVKPFSKDTINLIRINDWDFHWQGFYYLKKVVKIPRGSRLIAEAEYDNTTNNPRNPSNPPKDVKLGEGTLDEMMLTYFSYMPYQNGDENIVIDSVTITGNEEISHKKTESFKTDFVIYPNPVVDDILNIKYTGDSYIYTQYEIIDLQGKILSTGKINNQQIDVSNLQNGSYLFKSIINDEVIIKKFVK
jgi:hypothetical protein